MDWFKQAIRFHPGASLALATLLGLVAGLALSERPPLDWTKWSVIGQWANVVILIYVARIGATLPQRLVRQQHLREFRPLAEALLCELVLLLEETAKVEVWAADDTADGPNWEVFEKGKISHLLQRLDKKSPYTEYLVSQALHYFVDKMFFQLSDKIGTGDVLMEDKDNVHLRGALQHMKRGRSLAVKAIHQLCNDYDLTPPETI